MNLIHTDWTPNSRKLRTFGMGLIAIGILIEGVACWKGHVSLARQILAITFPFLGGMTLAFPTCGKWIYRTWMGITFPIGIVASNLILFVLYYGVVTPLGFVLRMRGQDPLQLNRSTVETYWIDCQTPQNPSYYERLA